MRCAIASLCAVLVVSTALAQQRPGGAGGTGSVVPMLGTNKQLHEELKMDADQIEKVAAALKKVNEDNKDDVAKLREQGTTQQERTRINRKLNEARTAALKDILKPEQMKRVRQIDIQRSGAGAFSRADVQKALNFTDEQKEKIKGLADTLQKNVREANQGGANTPEAQKKVADLRKEALGAMGKLLTEEQAKAFKELTGDPFELKPTRPNP